MDLIEVLSKNKTLRELSNFDQELKVHVLRNYTAENLEPYLQYYCNLEKVRAEVTMGAYNNMLQETMQEDSLIYSRKPQIVILSLTLHEYIDAKSQFVLPLEEIKKELQTLTEVLCNKTDSIIILNTFLNPFFDEEGIIISKHSLSHNIAKLNLFITELCVQQPTRLYLIDFNKIIALIGEEKTLDYRFSYISKNHFKNTFYNEYGKVCSRIARALFAKNKKVLVLDCDNTLWGGIIGEDGIESIKLGKGSSHGQIFYDFQASVLQLHARGVILALCSKNNEADVFEVLDKHPECLIKRNVLSAWKINWENKAHNIVALAEELNIGLDYFVFVDDSPVECNLVKETLPSVEVVQVPTKLYEFPNILLRSGIFDSLVISDEDKKRSEMYQAESLRKAAQQDFVSIKEYLQSLGIVVSIGINQFRSVSRLAQLTQKTNQFNLTTKRYTEAEISSFMSENTSFVFQFSVKDKYGDMGITGLMICRQKEEDITVDSFLLSCRVLGREIEFSFLNFCLNYLKERIAFKRVFASYLKSKKNSQTENFWEKNGFRLIETKEKNKFYEIGTDAILVNEYPHITFEQIE